MTIPVNSILFINIVIIVSLIGGIISGYTKGVLWQVIKTLGIIISILVCWILSPGFSELIQIFPKQYAPFKDTALSELFYEKINTVVCFLILFVICLIVIAIIKPIFKVVTDLPIVKELDKGIGAILGVVPSLISIILVTYVLNLAIFSNGKDIIEGSLLRYTSPVTKSVMSIVSDTFEENVAIQKMISDPLSLQQEDLENIVNWFKDNQITSEDIYNFLKEYGIDTNKINELLNQEKN